MKSKMKKSKNVLFAMTAAAAVMSLTGCGGTPELAQEVYTVELGSEMSTDPADYITVEGADDKHTAEILEKIVVDVSSVDTEAVGEYEGSAAYSNKTLKFKVKVEDTVAPVGELVNEWADVVTGTEISAADLVTGVEDKTDVSVQFVKNSLTEHIEESVEKAEETTEELSNVMTFETAGDFDLIIRLTDTSGNRTDLVQKMHVSVPDTTAPEIRGTKNITISVGKTPDYLKGVTAEDEVDGDLTESISVDDSQVNTKKIGTYKVVYTCTDAAGNTAEKEITVTVKKKAEAKPKNNINTAVGEQAGAPENAGGSGNPGGSNGSGSSGGSSSGGGSNSGGNSGSNGGNAGGNSGNSSSGNTGGGDSGSDTSSEKGEEFLEGPVNTPQLPPDFHGVTGPLEGELEIPPESSWYQK